MLATLGLLSAPLLGTASAAIGAFTATVGAEGTHITISNNAGAIPTFNELDAGLSTAQASLGSLGDSAATASNPDPGVVGTLPGVGETLVPQLLPSLLKIKLPVNPPPIDYPLTASAQNGQPPQSVGTGPVKLTATASTTAASAKAVVGATADGTSGAAIQTSTANVRTSSDGSVTATATTAISSLEVTNLITLGQIKSVAAVTRESDGTLKRSATMSVGLLDVAGLNADFTNGKLLFAGTTTPVALTVLNTLLHTASAGRMTLSIQKAENTKNGVISPVLQLVINAPQPPKCVRIKLPTPIVSGVAYCGVTTITYDLGRTDASITYSAAPATGSIVPSSTSSTRPTSTGTSTSPMSTSPSGGTIPSISDGSIPSEPDTTGGATGSEPPQVASGSPATIELAAQKQLDFVDIYTAIIGLAVLGLGAATCLRYLGVRDKWTS